MSGAKDLNYANDCFLFNRWILRCAGLWAPKTPSKVKSVLYTMYAVTVFLFVNVYFTLTEFVSLMETYGDMHDVIKNLSFALTHMMGAVKVIFWFYRGKDLIRIMDTLESDEFHYENTEIFMPGIISQQAKRTGIKYTFVFYMLAHMTLSSSYIPPLLTTIFNPSYIEDRNGNFTFYQKLPYFSWMPFRIDSPTNYLWALGYQAGPMFSYAYSIVGMDTLFMNIMNFIGAHLSILQGAFKTIRIRCIKRISCPAIDEDGLHNTPNLSGEMQKELRKSIRHLQTVFNICEDLENIHKYLTLGQVLATLFILCTCLFLVSTAPMRSKQFAAEVVYMIAMGFQLVLYCWFGNEVTLKANEMPMALWEGEWLETDHEFRSNMIFTMMRMRRPLHLTVGKFAPLTLNTFVAILKGSYSFFAVLKNTNV